MPFVRAGALQIYCEIAGSGPRLLFIGGTGGDLRHAPNVFQGPLPGRFEVLAYDQRGLGRSDKPAAAYSMADYADDAAALLEALDWERARVMGVSFGGMVAQELALRHPQRVERLVLACTSSGGAGGASYPLHELQQLDPRERALRGLALADTRHDEDWRAQNPDGVEKLMEFALARTDPDPTAEATAGARRQLEARRRHDTWDRLPGLRAPTLVCGGRYDGIAPPDNLQALAKQIPNADLAFFEGGHLFFMQDRAAFPRIIEFLDGSPEGESK